MMQQGCANPIADSIASRLAVYLGPHTARNAVKTFSMKALGRGPDTLTAEDVPRLADALRPVLRTFVGRAQAEVIVERIARKSGS
ncbi:hypothetical protein [Chondromyces apiculatus]|uniref:Uncharacterized protein n=1 Tax=Chondromyces apiculatus DSM 436 TaxID=1192034 RepID=A0A017STR6_9BACT|nr:hypothetical protein [Chondromyces apiculatus]EYF00152.1 Hypothetical protein CAP_1139 [Chondromyces apiculatus DSM 436]